MSEQDYLLEERKAGLEDFYKALIPSLVEFVGHLGIAPPHVVLKNAEQVAPLIDRALQSAAVADADERTRLIMRIGYFVGEYFTQRYSGCWYVNDIPGSRYYARYVVGRFSRLDNLAGMLDPFHAAQFYVDAPQPRQLMKLLSEIDVELLKQSR